MPLKGNIFYWEHSLEHPEPEVDEEPYIHDKIIVDDVGYRAGVDRLRDLITTYCTLDTINETVPSSMQNEGDSQLSTCSESLVGMRQKILEEIDKLLKEIKNIQHTEFVAYFKCLGMSHSIYRKLDAPARLAVLKKVLGSYCERRRKRYDQLGYTHVIQQALYDSAASRTQGSAAKQKLRQLIEQVSRELGVPIQEAGSPPELTQSESGCSFYAVNSKKGFEELREKEQFTYAYGQESQGKIPDLVIKIRDRLFILEAKHIRESGGAQDKQISELIKFIGQNESKPISYVAFLDGSYFNKFSNSEAPKKVRNQRDAIESTLKKYPNNYFVNTAGLCALLTDLISDDAADSSGRASKEQTI